MYEDDPFFEEIDHHILVWVGDLSPEELDEYLSEPGAVDDNAPISEFCRELGGWYDHDYVWMGASDRTGPLHVLFDLVGIEDGPLRDEIEKRSPSGSARCLLILWNARRRSESRRVTFLGDRLTCLGSWPQESPLVDDW